MTFLSSRAEGSRSELKGREPAAAGGGPGFSPLLETAFIRSLRWWPCLRRFQRGMGPDPSGFESFATSCRWYEASLKDSERKLAAPRIWQKLEGAAKSVVKHLEPKDFATETGMNKLLGVLRESPLQKLPIPDSFSRLEKWTGPQWG